MRVVSKKEAFFAGPLGSFYLVSSLGGIGAIKPAAQAARVDACAVNWCIFGVLSDRRPN